MKRKNILKSFAAVTAAAVCMITSMTSCEANAKNKEIKHFTGFFTFEGSDISSDNTIKKKIAEKIGADCAETWAANSDNTLSIFDDMILSGKYPDFIYAGEYTPKIIEAGGYIPLDDYIEKYPNISNYFTDDEWEKIRYDDGHIYVIPTFSKCYMQDTATMHDDEAFWIQVKVLQWAGYPKITTLDEYFDLIERYVAANPTDSNGKKNIGFEILTDGYLYFCLENPPMFLDGYPNDGACIVDKETLTAVDYNTTPTAKRWFKKLNEEYHKGIVDSDCFFLTKQQYFNQLSEGNVLGMVDQRWNFINSVSDLPDECTYVPLGVVIDEGVEEHYHSQTAFDASQGIGISSSCTDIEGAMQFINDLLEPEILNLRFWGIEGTDYSVDENGLFYLTDEQEERRNDSDVQYNERCFYSYFPYYKGMNLDGINACAPDYQPSEFYKQLSDIMKECFDAYGVKTYVEMLNPAGKNEPWYPLWSFTNSFAPNMPYTIAKENMDNIKHEYLPKVVMSSNFDSAWDDYMKVYAEESNSQAYIDVLTEEIRRCAGK